MCAVEAAGASLTNECKRRGSIGRAIEVRQPGLFELNRR